MLNGLLELIEGGKSVIESGNGVGERLGKRHIFQRRQVGDGEGGDANTDDLTSFGDRRKRIVRGAKGILNKSTDTAGGCLHDDIELVQTLVSCEC